MGWRSFCSRWPSRPSPECFWLDWQVNNEEIAEHGGAPLSLTGYALSGHFLFAIFENWESRFLQMSAYVMLSDAIPAWFRWIEGSWPACIPGRWSCSTERQARRALGRPGRRNGAGVYSYSLGTALALLFIASFILHLRYSAAAENAEAAIHGQPVKSVLEHLASAQFWFESIQNWQSEFLLAAVMVVLSIFLRFRGSRVSKPVAAPHSETVSWSHFQNGTGPAKGGVTGLVCVIELCSRPARPALSGNRVLTNRAASSWYPIRLHRLW
jgi:hypothetical protein